MNRVQYTMSTLFWALFGLPEMNIVDIRGVDHEFTETVGLMLYAAYHVIAIVVLLNVLIAMMSNTYTRIEVIYRAQIPAIFNRGMGKGP